MFQDTYSEGWERFVVVVLLFGEKKACELARNVGHAVMEELPERKECSVVCPAQVSCSILNRSFKSFPSPTSVFFVCSCEVSLMRLFSFLYNYIHTSRPSGGEQPSPPQIIRRSDPSPTSVMRGLSKFHIGSTVKVRWGSWPVLILSLYHYFDTGE